MKKIINVIAVIMLAAGFVILVKPYVSDYFIARENARITETVWKAWLPVLR